MDSLADNITMLRGYGAQFWLFVQDLSQLKAVYPRWQSFLANTTQQFFGTADYDTAKYLSDASASSPSATGPAASPPRPASAPGPVVAPRAPASISRDGP